MIEPENQPGSRRNAETTRQAILDAAETIFAEHGFAGARVDAIAKASGYNQGLIFRYFGDKQGLYAEVLRRIDRQGMKFQMQFLQPLLEDKAGITNPDRFREYLTIGVGAMLDYMAAHPQVIRMLLWEHAEGWQTYTKLELLFKVEDLEIIKGLFSKSGKISPESDLFVMLILVEQICWTFLSSFPFYKMILPDRDFTSLVATKKLREQIVQFIVAGILASLRTDELESE